MKNCPALSSLSETRFFLTLLLVISSIVISCKNADKNNYSNKDSLYKKLYANGKLKQEAFKNKDTIIIKDYYPNGKLKQEVHNSDSDGNDDSLYSGYVLCYDSNGIINMKKSYVKGNKSMIEKCYFTNGTLSHIGLYVNALEDSTWIWYYENNSIKLRYNYLHGKLFGESVSYFNDKKIEKYYFITTGERFVYLREYDSIGNIIDEQGVPISQICKDTFAINDTVKFYTIIGLLSDWDVNLSIKDVSKGGNKIIKQISNKNELHRNIYGYNLTIEQVCKKKGVYKWRTQMKITDKKYNREINYSDTLEFTVR
jgi:antitoxin component YwqK of YwqJK toxin-antitoxin module